MSDFTTHLEKRIEDTREELEKAKVVTLEAMAHQENLSSDLVGYEKVLDAELRRNGVPSQVPNEALANEAPQDLLPGKGQIDKTKFTKEVILRSGTAGIRAGDIIAAFEKAGVKVKSTYVYAILHRLKEGKKAKYRNGKYFLEKVTASE